MTVTWIQCAKHPGVASSTPIVWIADSANVSGLGAANDGFMRVILVATKQGKTD